jgi:nitrate reductase gamma subunit
MPAGTKQLLAMTAGGIFGVTCLIGMVLLIRRRMSDPRIRATSQFSDLPILLILFVQLVLGLITIPFSAQHMDGSSMIALASWAQHIVTFQGDAAGFIAGEAFIFKIHIVLGLTIFLVFPFTRLVHIWSVPVQYLTRSGYQIVRKRG